MPRGWIPILILTAIAVAGCSRPPEWYPIPEQSRSSTEYPVFLGRWVPMNDPFASAYIVRDVSQKVEASSWRWTFKRPELKFYLAETDHLKFAMDFAIAGGTFEQTGPVTLSFFVNGTPLDRVRYSAPGQLHYEKPVPPSLLLPSAINRVTIESDKVWVSKQDGTALGFILAGAGFIDR